TGVDKDWYDDGPIYRETTMRNGIPNGVATTYAEDGSVLVHERVRRGRPGVYVHLRDVQPRRSIRRPPDLAVLAAQVRRELRQLRPPRRRVHDLARAEAGARDR